MRLLLDTHVWVWAIEDDRKLGRKTKALLRRKDTERFVCAVSALELARLVWSHDITLQIPLGEWVSKSLEDLKAELLPVTLDVALEAYRLPDPFHRDPADRQIVACARIYDLSVLTADERILEWGHIAAVDARR